MLRRRSVMTDQTISDAKYPLVNGRHEFSDGTYIEVTNGNHVKIVGDTSDNSPSQTYASINFTNINNNTGSLQNYANSYQNTTYPLRNGDTVVLKYTNIQKDFVSNFGFNGYIANSTKSAGLNTIGTPDTTEDRIENIVLTQNKDVGALFCFSSVLNGTIEFDVSMEVNGERWI